MSFVYALALGVALLAVLPYLAHRLRRRRAEEREFPAARLVAPAPPKARRRSKLEDRALFGARAAAIAALALLGASPLVRCSRLSLTRSGGASVALAIVLDDSMSMRAPSLARAKRELLASAREGDAVAVVLAGAPARVALAATTDLAAARAVIDRAEESDRGTDLDAALSLARGLVSSMPQVDRRVVVLSDLADGNPEGPPLGGGEGVPVWIPLPELRQAAADCAILAADRSAARVRVTIACSKGASARGREVTVTGNKGEVLAKGTAPESGELTIVLPKDDADVLTARLAPGDAVASDDVAPVVVEAGPGSIAVVADTTDEAAATGGAPVVEQALSALRLDVQVRPIPAVPDRADDLAPFLGVLVDDVPGFTPEQRHALEAFFEAGGVALVALGPRSAAAPLGASFEPILKHASSWATTAPPGADTNSVAGPFADTGTTMAELAAKGRGMLQPDDVAAFEALVKWKDGAPLIARRQIARGEAWIVTLPFAVDTSDITLRPAFLALLDAWAAAARARAAPRRGDVGLAWNFPGARDVLAEGPGGKLTAAREGNALRLAAPLIGAYAITVDGKKEMRVAAPVARELDLRPRGAAPSASAGALGDTHASVDASPYVAVLLLLVVAVEMGLRLWARSRAEATA